MRSFGSLALMLMLTRSLPAQSFSLQPGSRIRLTSCPSVVAGASCTTVGGTFEGQSHDDLLVLAENGEHRKVALASLRDLRVADGVRAHAGRGALVGLGAGLIAMAIVNQGCFSLEDRYTQCGLGGYVLVPAGAATGALIGAMVKTIAWREIRFSPSVSWRGGPSIGIAIRH